eukprot:749858-Hanusia_phi.AAC.3
MESFSSLTASSAWESLSSLSDSASHLLRSSSRSRTLSCSAISQLWAYSCSRSQDKTRQEGILVPLLSSRSRLLASNSCRRRSFLMMRLSARSCRAEGESCSISAMTRLGVLWRLRPAEAS